MTTRPVPAALGRATVALFVLAALQVPQHGHAQTPRPTDLRAVHARIVSATVRIEYRTRRRASRGGDFVIQRQTNSGWLLAQTGRPLVVTNGHIQETTGNAYVLFYAGAGREEVAVRAEQVQVSRTLDLRVLRLLEDSPASVRPLRLQTNTVVVRGQRVVLAGNPTDDLGNTLRFQSVEGIVSGHASGRPYFLCGPRRACVIIDCASFAGEAGGPVVNADGELVGMLWGGPSRMHAGTRDVQRRGTRPAAPRGERGTHRGSFAYMIHARTIAAQLQEWERR